MKELHAAVQRLIGDIEAVVAAVDSQGLPLKKHHRQTFELQLQSLRVVDSELHERVVTRRVWSLGEATIPVVRAMLRAAGRPKVGVPSALVDQAQASNMHLRQELHRFAEGRSK